MNYSNLMAMSIVTALCGIAVAPSEIKNCTLDELLIVLECKFLSLPTVWSAANENIEIVIPPGAIFIKFSECHSGRLQNYEDSIGSPCL